MVTIGQSLQLAGQPAMQLGAARAGPSQPWVNRLCCLVVLRAEGPMVLPVPSLQ